MYNTSYIIQSSNYKVWKARNKLDRRIYAVKKIDLNSTDNALAGQNKIRREVTTISRLLHKHIVRYFAAWVEEYEDHSYYSEEKDVDPSTSYSNDKLKANTSDSSSVNSKLQSWMNDDSDTNIDTNNNDKDTEKEKFKTKSSYSRFFHYNSSSSDEDDDDEMNIEMDQSKELIDTSNSLEIEFNSSSDVAELNSESFINIEKVKKSNVIESVNNDLITNNIIKTKHKRLLFIQMEYCYTTLREFIDKGELWQQPYEIAKLLRQLLEALAYIHDRGVLHRDLKVCFFMSISYLNNIIIDCFLMVIIIFYI